ncbi:MAG TPA: lysylphosphatidylglycerol synthase domain-containing protein [Solirubrobacteraceae bacterium]|nr:lysylphosphatidylglycerol synthase domain-containing protein [Solirubrobacteraceae bacterium]
MCPAAIIAWARGDIFPRSDLTRPWAIIPPIGFVLGFWLAERYRDRLRDKDGWRGRIGLAFDSFHIVHEIMGHPRRYGAAVLGMLLYWLGDMSALWAATAAFGFHMGYLAVIVCLGTGMVFTRRTAPLGGAGLMLVALTATLWYGAAVPFSIATLGVTVYRILTLWAPLPAGFAVLPTLRALGEAAADTPGQGTRTTKGEPALQH